jgi:hypothetical protein
VCEAPLERRLKRPFIRRSGSTRHNRQVDTLRFPNRSLLGLLVPLVLVGPPARADGDQDRARAAVQSGEVLPLRTLVERLAREHPGEVLEVELEREDGRWVYEIKLLQPGGRLVKLEVDAATGQVLRLRERSRRSEARR